MTDLSQIQKDAYAFNKAIRNRLDTEMRENEFTSRDFHDLADKHGKDRKQITGFLYKLQSKYGLLKVVKTTRRPEGGCAMNTYRVVKGASFEIKNLGEIKKEVRNKIKTQEDINAQCVRRLEKAMSKFVSVGYEAR